MNELSQPHQRCLRPKSTAFAQLIHLYTGKHMLQRRHAIITGHMKRSFYCTNDEFKKHAASKATKSQVCSDSHLCTDNTITSSGAVCSARWQGEVLRSKGPEIFKLQLRLLAPARRRCDEHSIATSLFVKLLHHSPKSVECRALCEPLD